jgi:hypothetical protein
MGNFSNTDTAYYKATDFRGRNGNRREYLMFDGCGVIKAVPDAICSHIR